MDEKIGLLLQPLQAATIEAILVNLIISVDCYKLGRGILLVPVLEVFAHMRGDVLIFTW